MNDMINYKYLFFITIVIVTVYLTHILPKKKTCSSNPKELYNDNSSVNESANESAKVDKNSKQVFILPIQKTREPIEPLPNEIVIKQLEDQIVHINRCSMEDVYGSREFRQIDRNVNDDQLTEPVQRYPYNYYPKPPLVQSVNIATRGIPDNFSFIGNLYREYDNKILKLYGRRRYDELWDYYVVFNSDDSLQTKINLPTRNYRQLFDGDDIEVDMLRHGGKFKVFLNKQDEFTYSPYVMY
jgi:hypothetical protein